jgi:hypothetical protein
LPIPPGYRMEQLKRSEIPEVILAYMGPALLEAAPVHDCPPTHRARRLS